MLVNVHTYMHDEYVNIHLLVLTYLSVYPAVMENEKYVYGNKEEIGMLQCTYFVYETVHNYIYATYTYACKCAMQCSDGGSLLGCLRLLRSASMNTWNSCGWGEGLFRSRV